MESKAVNPVAAATIIVLIIAVAAFLFWKMSSPPVYNGPPIDMGAHMKQSAPPPGVPGR